MVGILKVGTLAKDRFPHARVRVEVRTREGAFLKVFDIESSFSRYHPVKFEDLKQQLEALEL